MPHGVMLTVIRLNFRFDFDKVAIMHATLQRYYGFNCEQHNHNTVTIQTALKLDAYITEVVDCAHHIAFKSKKQVRSIIRSSLSQCFLTCFGYGKTLVPCSQQNTNSPENPAWKPPFLDVYPLLLVDIPIFHSLYHHIPSVPPFLLVDIPNPYHQITWIFIVQPFNRH